MNLPLGSPASPCRQRARDHRRTAPSPRAVSAVVSSFHERAAGPFG